MHLEVKIPDKVPAMILQQTVFFPQAILPLHIFEPRYRQMLSDVLSSNQLFIVACQDETRGTSKDEIPCRVATIGVIRASEIAPNGTSNLVLQGLQRVKVKDVVSHDPYPLLQVEPLLTPEITQPDFLASSKANIGKILAHEPSLTNEVPTEFMSFLEQLEEYETYIDLLVFAACSKADLKQKLLSTASVEERYLTLLTYLQREHSRCNFERDLNSRLPDVDTSLN
jgi:ATP-dependent Lon protease|tara:strand:- start:59688 stop:60365 length:678 start_codon:yes stop_codon:yes gene_type:complete